MPTWIVAIRGTASAIFFNMGQCCTAGSRLFAHKRVFDRLMEGIASEAGKISMGPGLDPDFQMGPLVSEEQFARVTGFLEVRPQGGRDASSPAASDVGNAGYFVAPTVLTDTRPTCRWCATKSSGPSCAAIPFDDDDLDRIAKEANNTNYGLAASVWTRDLGIAHKLARRIRAGTVWINTHNFGDVALPVRRLQGVRLGPRNGQGSAGTLHRNQSRRRRAMTDRSRIDTAQLDGVRLSPDGSRLILLLRDTAGRRLSVSLPTNCLNSV